MASSELDTLFSRFEHKQAASPPIPKIALFSAAGVISFSRGGAQRQAWDRLARLLQAYLDQQATQLSCWQGAKADIEQFLLGTSYDDISHFRRRDPHLWAVHLHVIRADNRWLALHLSSDGFLFTVGHAEHIDATLFDNDRTEASDKRLDDLQALLDRGFHRYAAGKATQVAIGFYNGRPVDQTLAILRCNRLLGMIECQRELKIFQNKSTAFFDPRIFPNIADRPNFAFYTTSEQDVKGRYFREGGDWVESFYLPDQGNAELSQVMQSLRVALQAPSDCKPATPSDETFRLFVSLELEKRVWIEQAEALLCVMEHILTSGRRLTVVINGMTGVIFEAENRSIMGHFKPVTEREENCIAFWRSRLPPDTEFEFLGGQALLQKLSAVGACDFALAPSGTATWIAQLAGIPGAHYSHPGLNKVFENLHGAFPNIRPICRSVAKAETGAAGVFQYSWAGLGGESYSIPVDAFLGETRAVLQELGLG